MHKCVEDVVRSSCSPLLFNTTAGEHAAASRLTMELSLLRLQASFSGSGSAKNLQQQQQQQGQQQNLLVSAAHCTAVQQTRGLLLLALSSLTCPSLLDWCKEVILTVLPSYAGSNCDLPQTVVIPE
jgi:hypothetical protein